jgi:hypothetical protein
MAGGVEAGYQIAECRLEMAESSLQLARCTFFTQAGLQHAV